MRLFKTESSSARNRGSAMVMVVLLLISLAGISLAMASMSGSGFLESRGARQSMRSFQLAEAGLSESWAILELYEEDALALACADPLSIGPDQVEVTVTLGATSPVLAYDRIMLSARSEDGTHTSVNVMTIGKQPNGQFRYALFGDEEIVIDSNALVDSYNSLLGPYDPDSPGDLADVGSNGDIELKSNVEVYGNVIAGPTGVIEEAASGSSVSREISNATELVALDPIAVPSIVSSGPLTVSSSMTVGPGDIHFDSLLVQGGGELNIVGPARLVLDDLEVLSNASINIDALAGKVEIHCLGDVLLKSNSEVVTSSNQARDILLNVAWDPDLAEDFEFDLSSNSQFEGLIYAPESEVILNSNFEVFGAIYAESLVLESNARVHFDERLLFDDGVPVEYFPVSWTTASIH